MHVCVCVCMEGWHGPAGPPTWVVPWRLSVPAEGWVVVVECEGHRQRVKVGEALWHAAVVVDVVVHDELACSRQRAGQLRE